MKTIETTVSEQQVPAAPSNPLTSHSCVPYCEAAFLIGDGNGWDKDRTLRFIDALDDAIVNQVLFTRNADGAAIHQPRREQHAEWHLRPIDVNAWLGKDEQPFRWILASLDNKQADVAPTVPTSLANTVSCWDAKLDAIQWFGFSRLTAIEAAQLLCGLNPKYDARLTALLRTDGEPKADDFKLMQRVFEDVALDDQPRSLRQWLEVANQRNLKVHSWIDEWIRHGGNLEGKALESDMPAVPNGADSGSAPQTSDGIDYALLATRQQLIEAFGVFTGMNDAWFDNLNDTPKLKSARKVAGQGGRGHITEPLFCPFAVMQWIADRKRKKGRPMSEHKAWDMLERHFPRVYAARSIGDPRPD